MFQEFRSEWEAFVAKYQITFELATPFLDGVRLFMELQLGKRVVREELATYKVFFDNDEDMVEFKLKYNDYLRTE